MRTAATRRRTRQTLLTATAAATIAALTATGVAAAGAPAGQAARAPETPTRLTPDDVVVSGFGVSPVRVGDALYYQAYSAGTGDREVWRTTDDGVTEQVTDINPDGGSQPGPFTAAGDLLLYAANDGTTGYELWQTDTTTGETTRLTDLDDIPPTDPPLHGPPDEVDGDTNPTQLTVVGDTLYFQGDDGHTGRELWQTDLTTGTTKQTADLRPGGPYSDSSPSALTVVGDDLLFVARTKGVGYEIWKHDTTTGRTTRLTDVDGYLSTYADADYVEGDLLVKDGSVFFTVDDDTHGSEPWRADLATGRARVDDLNPGPASSAPDFATLVGHRLFFSARDGRTGQELWQTNTRTGTTRQRADIQPGGRSSGSFPQELARVGHVLYFSARAQGSDQELWRTSPGRPGVEQVADINPGAEGSWPVDLVAVGQDLYFAPTDVGNGAELWRAGPGGAALVADLADQPGPGDARIDELLDDEGRLVFDSKDGLWTLG